MLVVGLALVVDRDGFPSDGGRSDSERPRGLSWVVKRGGRKYLG